MFVFEIENLIQKFSFSDIQDSETANYISANTKDCPKCKVCIEKNGGKKF